jgi:signal transduction histidine kinase
LQPRSVPVDRPPPDAPGWFWRDRLLQGACAICVLLIAYQLAVTLLHPPWGGVVTSWLRTILAWLALLVVGYVAWRSVRAQRLESPAWWLFTAALLTNAIAYTIRMVEDVFLNRYSISFPTFADFLFAVQYPFIFLAVILIPRRRPATPRVILILDFLLWMGAALALSWFFMLAPIVTDSDLSPLGKLLALSAPVGDLLVLLGLTLILLRPPYSQQLALVLGLLIAAFACLIVGDTGFTLIVLQPPHAYPTGQFPDLFWLTCYLLIPLAALIHLRIMQRERAVNGGAASHEPSDENLLWRDIRASLPHFLPIVAALLASATITIGAIVRAAEPEGKDELWAVIAIFGLLLLVFMRQAIMCLNEARLHRERAVAQVREQALVELNRRKDEFLGIVSHELRTPLSSMQGYLQMLARLFDAQRPQDDGAAATTSLASMVARARAIARYCLQSLRRLIRLADDLVDDTRIREGRLTLHLVSCDLGHIVRAAVEEQRALESDRTITLEWPPVGPVLVMADADRIAQVVTNYLTNALKYSRVDLPVTTLLEVEGDAPLGEGAAACLARVSVHDDGPGLSLADQVHVWERFPRIEAVTVQTGSGMSLGLGLSISKAIIERHGGQVGVESASGKGSTFWFTLPVTTLAPPATTSS